MQDIHKGKNVPRLLIFDDQLFHNDGENYFGTDARITFLMGLKGQFKSVHFFAKAKLVSDKYINESFILNKDIKFHEISYPSGIIETMITRILFLPKIIRQIKNVYTKEDYMALPWPHPLSYLIWHTCKQWKNKPEFIFFARQNGYTAMEHNKATLENNLKRSILHRMGSYFYKNASNEIVFAVGKRMKERYENKIAKIYEIQFSRISEKDIAKAKSSSGNAKLKLLYVSGHTDYGLESMLLSMESLLKIGVDLELHIIGRCKDISTWQLLVNQKALTNNVYFHPEINHANGLYSYYANSDLMVVPVLKGNMPKSITEALSFGLPIVAPYSIAVEDVLTHQENAWLFKTNDFCSMVDGIYYLYKNKKIREGLKASFDLQNKVYTIEYQYKILRNALADAHQRPTIKTGNIVKLNNDGANQGLKPSKVSMQWLMRLL